MSIHVGCEIFVEIFVDKRNVTRLSRLFSEENNTPKMLDMYTVFWLKRAGFCFYCGFFHAFAIVAVQCACY